VQFAEYSELMNNAQEDDADEYFAQSFSAIQFHALTVKSFIRFPYCIEKNPQVYKPNKL
jgi:hypothetical protein